MRNLGRSSEKQLRMLIDFQPKERDLKILARYGSPIDLKARPELLAYHYRGLLGISELRLMVLIIGGGIMGLTAAYNIAQQADCDVTIIEQSYIGSGASTRNAGHFRVHFWAPENIRFAIESSKRLQQFTSRNGLDPEIHYGGYLWLLSAEEQVKSYVKSNNESWTKMGVPGKFLQPKEVLEEYPYLNVEGIIAGFQGSQDGKLNPNIITLGYYKRCKETGVNFLTYTKVEKLVLEDKKVVGVQTDRGFVKAEKVLVAAGAWSGELLKTANIDLPLEPERKEIGVTEPIKYFLDPFVISVKNNAYVGQMLRGEIIGSIEYPIVKGLVPLVNTLDWYHAYAKAVSDMIPLIKHLMFLRSWAGYYAITPDRSHILGRELTWPENLYVATGFSGHGLMMAPLAGELMAKNILNDKVDELMKPFLPTRFKEGALLDETMKVG